MIIGISGKKQHGKDTVANIIQCLTAEYSDEEIIDVLTKKHEVPDYHLLPFSDETTWEKRQFAYKLKKIVCELIGCTMEQLEDAEFKEAPLGNEWDKEVPYPPPTRGFKIESLTPRKLLQLMGIECGRQIIHPNIWINATFADYKPKPRELGLADRSSDYPDWIITDVRFPNEAEAIKKRDGIIIRVNRPGMPEGDNHPSETALDDYKGFDWVFSNNSNLSDLILKTKTILDHYGINYRGSN